MSEDLRVKIDADVANNFENEKDNKIEYVKSILKEYLPMAIDIDGKVNFDNLKSELEKQDIKISSEKNSFQLYWAGKNEAIKKSCQDCKDRAIEPQQQESKDWNTTGNIFIEGDNLEALKMLKKSYSNKVKMIYIDPPYNTGKAFIYNDNFKISKKEYDNLTDKDREIYDKKMEAISSASGQKHSKWLSMMYPRLVAAKELLTDDGVIFISIDDNEQANLKLLCDEVFGEENFVKELVWESGKPFGYKATTHTWPRCHEYILHYAKNINKMIYNPTYTLELSSSGKQILTSSIIKAKENGIYSMNWIQGAKESVGFGSGQKPVNLIKKLLQNGTSKTASSSTSLRAVEQQDRR